MQKTNLFPHLKAHFYPQPTDRPTSVQGTTIPRALFHQSVPIREAEKGNPHHSPAPGTPFTWKNYFRTVRAEAKYSLPALILYGIFSTYLAGREEQAQEKKAPPTAPMPADKKV